MSKNVRDVSAADVIRFHWRHAMAFKKQVAISFIVAPISIILERYASALIIASLLASIQSGTVTVASSIWLLVSYAAILVVAMIIGYRVNLYASWSVQVQGARKIYNESFKTLTQHSLSFFNNTFTGSLVSKVSKFASAFTSFWNSVIYEVLFVVTAIIATLVGLSFIMWQYALVLLALVLVYVFSAFYNSRFMRPRQKARSEAYTKISAQLADAIGNIMAIKTDGREKYEQKRLKNAVDTMVDKEFGVRSGIIRVSTVNSSVISVMRVGALFASIVMIQVGIADAALVYLALTFTINLVEELSRVQATLRSYYQIVGDSEEMLEIMQRPVDIIDQSRKKLTVDQGRVEFDQLSFHYQDDKDSPVFDGLNLHIEGGQSVGVVGASGAGKTSLTKLILRFLDPTSGTVRIDNQDIAQVTQASLHEAISYVPQEPLLFHRSLKENIAYGRPDASEDEIYEAAKKANALDFIEKLPEGLETLVGERGVKLSGGQRQRIAIARAILKDAPILVLDEATSALDSESEKLIQKALRQLMKGRTSFVIAHRLSTIARLDRIIVMEHGAIIEDGSHEELLARGGRYAQLWSHQSGGFIEE